VVVVVLVVLVDVVSFRHQPTERLVANIGIVLVFAGFYPRCLRQQRATDVGAYSA
jgi:hypothetical protein